MRRAPRRTAAAFFRIEDARSPGELLDLAGSLSRMLPQDEEPGLRRAFTELLVETFRTAFPEIRISHVDDLEELHMLEQNMIRWRKSFMREAEKRAQEKANKEVRKQVQKEVREEERAEGRAQGRAEGQISGMRRLLQRQMELRFGTLPPAVCRRIGEISSTETLEDLAARLLTATRLSDLGLEEGE